MNLLYKDEESTVKINFYKKPAILELNHNGIITHITINGDFMDGNRNDAEVLLKWLNEVENALEDIIWEWQTGNDDFDLIDHELLFCV